MATIYYLNWDSKNNDEEKELFHDMHKNKNNKITHLDKNWYRKIGELNINEPEKIWKVCQRDYPVSDFKLQDKRNKFYTFKERSMSVGDIIKINNKKYIVVPIGFEEIKWN